MIVPQEEMPSLSWRWGLLILVVLLLAAAVMSGWFNMIATACTRYMERKEKSQEGTFSSLESFTLFRSFLPGIAADFPQFTLGALIQLGVVALLGFLVYPSWTESRELLMQIQTQGQSILENLTPAQERSLAEFSLMSLLALLLYLLFWLLTMLWPVYIVLYGANAFQAYWRSFMQFVRDPFRLLAISVLFATAQILPMIGTATGLELLMIVMLFVGMLANIYMLIVMFVYALQVIGKSTAQPQLGSNEALNNPPAA